MINPMQEIIVYIVILAAVIIVGFRAYKEIRDINKPDPCGGCGKSCEGCPIQPGKMKKKH
jgi:hypothetical protein